jgi:hypothetical protein
MNYTEFHRFQDFCNEIAITAATKAEAAHGNPICKRYAEVADYMRKMMIAPEPGSREVAF